MRQPSATDPTTTCGRCSAHAVCSAHTAYATAERPTAAALLAVVNRDRDQARGDGWRVTGTGNPLNNPTHD